MFSSAAASGTSTTSVATASDFGSSTVSATSTYTTVIDMLVSKQVW